MALTNEDLNAIAGLIQPLKADMQGMKDEMKGMKVDMQDMKADMQNMKADMQNMKVDMQDMKADMQEVKTDVTGMKDDMINIKFDIQELKHRVTKIEFTLEHEITPNISVIAEGHLDLSRKLNECVKISNDIKSKQEILDIFINMQKSKLLTL